MKSVDIKIAYERAVQEDVSPYIIIKREMKYKKSPWGVYCQKCKLFVKDPYGDGNNGCEFIGIMNDKSAFVKTDYICEYFRMKPLENKEAKDGE